ncbi:MAG: hypothetical protein M3N41_10260 [Acidobacteriota bacterium]|nr:hypothetical protein [Acidobacteriota bacterium]
MTLQAISRWLNRAGFVFLCLALLFFLLRRELTPEPGAAAFGGAAAELLFYTCLWISASLGALLFLGGPLLRLKWWYSWIAFIAIGALLWTKGPAIVGPFYVSVRKALPLSQPDFVVVLIGVAFIIMGFIFLAAQLLVRRPEAHER